MKAQGIPEVPEGFLHDHSWIEGANEQIGGGGGKQDHALLVAGQLWQLPLSSGQISWLESICWRLCGNFPISR